MGYFSSNRQTSSRGRGILLLMVSLPRLCSPHSFSLDFLLPPDQTHPRDPRDPGINIRRDVCRVDRQAGTRNHDQGDVGTRATPVYLFDSTYSQILDIQTHALLQSASSTDYPQFWLRTEASAFACLSSANCRS